jgi:hypothetical protein
MFTDLRQQTGNLAMVNELGDLVRGWLSYVALIRITSKNKQGKATQSNGNQPFSANLANDFGKM